MAEDSSNFTDVIDTLFNTFSGVIERDVIAAVVASYEGDLEQSANALMSFTCDLNKAVEPSLSQEPSQFQYGPIPITDIPETSNTNLNGVQSKMQYSQAFQKINKNEGNHLNPSNTQVQKKGEFNCNNNMSEIITQHNNGWRILVIMRGPPGCGKTHFAREILQMTVGCSQIKDANTHILSTDDYFMFRGAYKFDKYKLQDAHMWNQCRALTAMVQGISPVIIDNTNIELWEMEPYVRAGVSNGYIVHVKEPKTYWSRNAKQLFRRNIHNVPIHTIKRMLDNMQEGITGEIVVKSFGFHYPADFTPPVLRRYPELPSSCSYSQSQLNVDNQFPKTEDSDNITEVADLVDSKSEDKPSDVIGSKDHIEATLSDSCKIETETPLSPDVTAVTTNVVETNNVKIEKYLEEMEKLEQEWDNGDKWDECSQKPTTSNAGIAESTSSKPPRKRQIEKLTKPITEQSVISTEDSNDWRKFWTSDAQPPTVFLKECTLAIEKISSSTSIECGDMDISDSKNPYKIITATPRDINMFTLERAEKIPIQRMFDKSTSTSNEIISMQPFRCQNEKQHFKAFRKMFSNIPSADLRDIFENCCGDVNWAVEIVIDGMTNNQFCSFQEGNISEDEEDSENIEQCKCLAAYNIIPDHRPVIEKNPIIIRCKTENTSTTSPRRIRKEAISNASIELKRQIEENVVISENHYSEHHRKIKNLQNVVQRVNSSVDVTTENQQAIVSNESNLPSTSGMAKNARDEIANQNESDEDNASCGSEVEKTLNVNVGMEFIKQLDKLFGRDDMKYPENIEPKLNISMTLLNEINALWMESMMHQLEKDCKQTEEMIEQDAEFSRLLVAKEKEMLLTGKEPEVPDFKEIMDMDFALALYQRDVAEWRNKEPLDLAAKMTRVKLYNLFPDIAPEILSELLMAHGNNFQNTVEVLLISTGRSNIVETNNGVNKFVMEKEMERKNRLIEEQRKALSEVEWPLLPKDANLKMEDVEKFRQQAANHLAFRETNYSKAQAYIQRGMFSVASYCSQLGAFHTKLYEQASSKAATSLVYVNAQRCKDNATIDLHSFRVAEARESLDLFLDIHIRKLKDINGKNGVTSQTLYFLTGRGKHSPAGPKIKPAVKKRLRERGLTYYEMNPGLLAAEITSDNNMSEDIS